MKLPSVLAKLLRGGPAWALLLYVLLLTGFFFEVFLPGNTLFSNDGPLGELMAQCHRLPGRFTGCWADLNSVGFNSGMSTPDIVQGLQWLLGPIWFSKFYALISLLILGMGAWCFFRQQRLSSLACVLGGLAIMLNSSCFSVACWGVAAHDIAIGMCFWAMAAVSTPSARGHWLRVILAGFAVGMGVIEGVDVGVILSVLTAIFIAYQAIITEGSPVKNWSLGVGRLAVVTICALFLSAQSMSSQVDVSIKGVKGTEQDAQTRADRWDWATQWSLPKREILTLVVPGLFGYRLDTPGGGNYWGMMGRSPSWNKYYAGGEKGPEPKGIIRYTGGGNYAGVLVVLVGLWAAAEAWRRKASIFDSTQRKWLWLWSAVMLGALLLALGRYAPFYQFFYALPYVSTIRNPTKFLYIFGMGMAILFAYGIHGLERRYMPAGVAGAVRWPGFSSWWRRAARFDKNWVYGCGLVLAISLIGWGIYAQHHDDLEAYLQSVHVNTSSGSVADFSIQQIGWFVLFFSLAAGFLILIFSGLFAGKRATWGGFFLAALLIIDLGRANLPWIIVWDYHDKYASNPVVDLFRDQPYEHRVGLAPVTLPPKLASLRQVYRIEWMQHLFPYYNVQSIDIVDMPRMPEDFAAFLQLQTNSIPNQVRAWQLTNTRYIIAPANFAELMAQQNFLSPDQLPVIGNFEIVRKPGVTAVVHPDQLTAVTANGGPFAVFDYTNALPRAKLYSQWEINTNNAAALQKIFSPNFNPQTSVIVADSIPTNNAIAANTAPGTVDFVSYAPKDIILKAAASTASVLLLNDHFDREWKVFVDGVPQPLLRCNYLMQGVYVQSGAHSIEFKFLPPLKLLYVSIFALTVALLTLAVFIIFILRNRTSAPHTLAASLASVSEPAKANASKSNNSEAKKAVASTAKKGKKK